MPPAPPPVAANLPPLVPDTVPLASRYNALLTAALSGPTAAQLRAAMHANEQPASPNFATLVVRLADMATYGALPFCPECCGGVLHPRPAEQVAICRGYPYGDEICGCKFRAIPYKEIKRETLPNPAAVYDLLGM